MAKFNVQPSVPAVSSPVATERAPSTVTHEGGAGYLRADVKSELFLLAVTNMVGEKTFYEQPDARDARYEQLVRAVAVQDPQWTLDFLRWLRLGGNMRSASLVGAAEAVKARLEAGLTGDLMVSNRALVSAVLQRADEPGEFIAYWTSRYGRALPKPVKRGVADAVKRLVNERSWLKWDSSARGVRFGDVLELAHPTGTHPSIKGTRQGVLFEHILDDYHQRGNPIPQELGMVRARAELMAVSVAERRALLAPDRLKAAGMTWESLAGWLQGPLDAAAWEAVAPSMGYMALLRNLRNFDEAGVSDEVAMLIAAKLADPAEVASSRQLPMRFLSAHRAVPSLRWGHTLEKALGYSLGNVPALKGHTLVLVDTSSSMNETFSKDGTLKRWDAAVVFGLALASRCDYADVVSFSSNQRYWSDPAGANTRVFKLERAESLLRAIERWKNDGFFLGGGTDTVGAVQRHLRPGFHDRVVILTDEQAERGDVGRAVPQDLPLYTANLAGYRAGHAPSGSRNRTTFGGLSDSMFGAISLLEAGRDAKWPWVG